MNTTEPAATNTNEALPKAKAAVIHILRRIHQDKYVSWYMGHATESYHLLTEAFAAIQGQSVREVIEKWPPAFAKNPADAPALGRMNAERALEVLGHLEKRIARLIHALKEVDEEAIVEALIEADQLDTREELVRGFLRLADEI